MRAMEIEALTLGEIPPDPVAPESLKGVPRQQTNPKRWAGEGWELFRDALRNDGLSIREGNSAGSIYVTDAGGMAYGMPHGSLVPKRAEDVAAVMKRAQEFRVPVTTRGGGLTTEGESVAFGGLMLDMSGMKRVEKIDGDALTVRTQAGIFWHELAENLRREGLDYLSAPLNLTASVGGTIGVGGIDVNSPRLGCSADQVESMQVVTPTGEIMECNEEENSQLFERVLFGYGQFGVITEATLQIRSFTPTSMHYVYYSSLPIALEDMQMLVRADAADYCGILTMMDKGINLLFAFDSDEREKEFMKSWRPRLRGYGEIAFAFRMALLYVFRPWRWGEALYLASRRVKLFPEFTRPEYMHRKKLVDRSVVFSRAVWKFWGGAQMVIPDLATTEEKFIEAVVRGNEVCKKYFKRYTLYCVGIRTFGKRERYELSCVPPDATEFNYGCEFEPMLEGKIYSRDTLQEFKNEIYDIGVEMRTSYYRFGGMMRGYVRRVFPEAVVEKHLALKKKADPAMILNPNVIF